MKKIFEMPELNVQNMNVEEVIMDDNTLSGRE